LDVRTASETRIVMGLSGELDIVEADAVRRILMAEAQVSPAVVLDLADLSSIDLSGVRALHDAQRAARECSSRLVLVSPPRCLTGLVGLLELGPMPFSEDRSLLEQPRPRADARSAPSGRRVPARRARAAGVRTRRASSLRLPAPCPPDGAV
jgi:anti-anti-sigma factor